MTMSEREELLAEIRRLLDEQMETLRNDLTPAMLQEYQHRRQKIQQLVDRIIFPSHDD